MHIVADMELHIDLKEIPALL